MTARSGSNRNIRGRGLPACGRGVTVPASMKPKPNRINGAIATASLSKPAARPIGLAKSRPNARVASTGSSGVRSRPARSNRRAHNAMLCDVSGSTRRSKDTPTELIPGNITVDYGPGRGILKGCPFVLLIKRGEGQRDVEQALSGDLLSICPAPLDAQWQGRSSRRVRGRPLPGTACWLGLGSASRRYAL